MRHILFFLAACFVAVANAFWRMECPQHIGVARLDPIVYPGALSTHLHSIHGSSGFSENSGTQELLAGNCTSCRVTQDKSSYWIPTLHFQDAETHEFELVDQVGGMLAYYLLYGENVTAFPSNFRMLSGDNFRRSYSLGDPSLPDPEKSIWATIHETTQADLAQRAIGFNCLNYNKPPEGTLYRHFMPGKDYIDSHCHDGLRIEVMFPSCWKGGDLLDTSNHKDHVAFPDLVMTGTCPPDFPVRLPSLLYEVIFNTPAYKNRKGRFVFSNGDTTGFGLHADFMMGWDEQFLQEAIDTCTNDSGRIEDCPLFNIVTKDQAAQCQIETLPHILQKENVAGPARQLPGGVNVTGLGGSPDPGYGQGRGGLLSPLLPTLSYQPGDTVRPSETPVPGKVLDASFSLQDKAASSSVPAPLSSSQRSTARASPSSTMWTGSPSNGRASPAGSEVARPSSTSSGPHAAWLAPVTTTIMVEAVPTTESTSYLSTQFITKGTIVSEILWKQETITVTETDCTTVTETAAISPTPDSASAETETMEVQGLRGRKLRRGRGHGHGSRFPKL